MVSIYCHSFPGFLIKQNFTSWWCIIIFLLFRRKNPIDVWFNVFHFRQGAIFISQVC